jgi:hypothetical protein
MDISFEGKLWEYPGAAAWVFVSLPKDYTDELKAISSSYKKGFGSIRVTAVIGTSTWKTSIFPDSKSGTYMLPVKKVVREQNKLADGSVTKVKVTLLDV